MKNTIHLQSTLVKSLLSILFLAPTQIASATDTEKENLTQILKTLQKEKNTDSTEKKKGYLQKKTNTKRSTSKKPTIQTWGKFIESERSVTKKDVLAEIQKSQKEQKKENEQEIKKIEKRIEKDQHKFIDTLQGLEKGLEKLEKNGIRGNQQLAQQTQTLESLSQKSHGYNQQLEKMTQDTRERKKELGSISQDTREMNQQVERISQGISGIRQEVEDVSKGMQKNIQAEDRTNQKIAGMIASIKQTRQERAQAREENIQATLLTTPELTLKPITDYNPNTLHSIISQPQTQECLTATATRWERRKSILYYILGISVSVAIGYCLGGQKSPKKPL